MNTQFLEKAKDNLPFSLLVTIEPKEDLFIGILFNNKPINNKIEKEFSKGSKIKILVTKNINYNGLEVTICTDDKTIDHYTLPNKVWDYEYSVVYGNKCIAHNKLFTSKTGYILTDLLLDMIMNRQYINNINVSIPDVHFLYFRNNDDMLYHYHNLVINAVCNNKKVIELSYTLNHTIKDIHIYTSEHRFVIKRSDKIIEYTIGKNKYYLFKSNEDSKDLIFIKNDQKVNIDATHKRKIKYLRQQIIKNDIELHKVINGGIY